MSGGADGEEGSGELVRQAGPVRRWLTGYFRRRIGDEAEVEDLVQDVFARLVAREGEEPVANLQAYVLKTASSVAADRGRRRSARLTDRHVPFDPELHGREHFDPERVLAGRKELDAAVAALLALPERTRTIFVLRRFEGYSYRDIALHLGISVSAVEKHLVKALNHLVSERDKRCDP